MLAAARPRRSVLVAGRRGGAEPDDELPQAAVDRASRGRGDQDEGALHDEWSSR